jgi:hypothetical protein
MGRAILALGILSILVPVEGVRTAESKPGRELAYDGLQGLLEGVAMGIEERQSEMKEMDKNMSIRRMELLELEKTVRRRQMLLDLTSRKVEESLHKLEVEKRRVVEERVQAEEPINCTERDDNRNRKPSDEGIQNIRTASHGGVHPLWSLGKFGLGRGDQLADHRIKGLDIEEDRQQHGCFHQHE